MLKTPKKLVKAMKISPKANALVIVRYAHTSETVSTKIAKIKISAANAQSGIFGEFSIKIDSAKAA